jgi:hypothetical protein
MCPVGLFMRYLFVDIRHLDIRADLCTGIRGNTSGERSVRVHVPTVPLPLSHVARVNRPCACCMKTHVPVIISNLWHPSSEVQKSEDRHARKNDHTHLHHWRVHATSREERLSVIYALLYWALFRSCGSDVAHLYAPCCGPKGRVSRDQHDHSERSCFPYFLDCSSRHGMASRHV